MERKGRSAVCTLHVPDFIVRVPRDANALRAVVGHDFNTSCLQQTYNQPRMFYEVVWAAGSNPHVPLEQ